MPGVTSTMSAPAIERTLAASSGEQTKPSIPSSAGLFRAGGDKRFDTSVS